MEVKNEKKFNDEQMGMIHEISDQIYDELGIIESKIITKTFIFGIFLALLKSVPIPHFLTYVDNYDDENDKEYLINLYDDYQNIKKVNFFTKDIRKRIKYKYDYYKATFKIRIRIQNIDWYFHGFDKDVTKFIYAKELAYIANNHLPKMKNKELVCCSVCSTKWLNSSNDVCPRCSKDNDLSMFIKLSNFFMTLGDMTKFYKYLDEATSTVLYDNWNYVLSFFETQRKKRYHKKWAEMKKEYGIPQYNKIIKLEGGDHGMNPELTEFNRKYKVALVSGTQLIDLTDAKNIRNKEFFEDFNKLKFPFCAKVIFPAVKIDINEFKPNMERLKYIDAEGCEIKNINLDPVYFQSLHEINLNNNKIESYNDIINIKNIKSLKILNIAKNPIERKNDIYKLDRELEGIMDVRYCYIRKYPNKAKIEEESDEEVKELKKKWLDFDESESEKSK